MKYSIVYSSKTGNTAMLALKIKDQLPQEDCIYYGEPNDEALEASIIFVGFWTDKGTCDVCTHDFLTKLDGKTVIPFGTAGFIGDTGYYKGILSRMAAVIPAGNKVVNGFMCQGKMAMSVRDRYEASLAQKPGDQQILIMIDNFDKALSHPDEDDLSNLCEWLKGIRY